MTHLKIFNVEPKQVTDIDTLEYTIWGLQGKVVSMPFSFDDETFEFKLLFEFVDQFGSVIPQFSKNLDRDNYRKAAVPRIIEAYPQLTTAQATATADQQINQLLAGLISGTQAQRYAAAQALASSYNFILKPLEEQINEPVPAYFNP